MSQPAVSKLLQALEAETRLALFDRSRRRLVPTLDAARLHVEVERLFRNASAIDQLAAEIRAGGVGELRIVALPLLGNRLLPGWLAEFAAQHPGIRSSLAVTNTQGVIRSVAAGEADLGFALATGGDAGVARQTLVEIPGVIALPRRHALANRRTLTPRDLDGESFISLGRLDEARELVDRLFDSHGVSRRIDFETNVSAAACALVAAGAGVALVDALTPSAFARQIVVRRIHPTVRFRVELLTRIGRPSPLLERRFLQFAQLRLRDLVRGAGRGQPDVSR